MGRSELYAGVEGPGLSHQDHGSVGGLLEVPKRQFHLPLDPSLLQNQLLFDREIILLGLKAWLLLPHRKSCPPRTMIAPFLGQGQVGLER